MRVQSLDRAFDILELLSKEQNGLTITDIGKQLDLHKSTVHRLLASLKQKGYIEKKLNSHLYKLGLGFIDLCSGYLNNLELKIEAEPFLRKLSMFTTQTVFLAIQQDFQAVYIDKVEKYNSLRRYSIIGQRAPLYCTALGKSLIIGFQDEEIRKNYENHNFISKTNNTITNIDKLFEEINITRKRGWSLDNEEFELGVKCIAAPIYDYRKKIISAVSTSWYTDISNNLEIDKIAQYVMDTAVEISRRMGYRK
jgi:IclR family transcriptional regulator, KDG regulon repressor